MTYLHSFLLAILALLCLDLCQASIPHRFEQLDPSNFACHDDFPVNTRIDGEDAIFHSFERNIHQRRMNNAWDFYQHSVPGILKKNQNIRAATSSAFQRRRSICNNNDDDSRHVVLCASSPWMQDDTLNERDNRLDNKQGLDDIGMSDEDRRTMETFTRGRRGPHTPLVYRYYGRSRPRMRSGDSIPFVLLGPNVDHWKTVGQILATRGFSVMACERLPDDGEQPTSSSSRQNQHYANEGANIALEILDALRWNRAIFVGCDSESILAIETAMQLAPDRIAGLVLCGDLTDAEQLAANSGVDVLDDFLRNVLDCPFTIVWDGGASQSSRIGGQGGGGGAMTSNVQHSDRSIILGGGSAPHRLRPEQFAWVLTRFVEEKIPPLAGGRRLRNGGEPVRRVQGAQTRAGDQRWSGSSSSNNNNINIFKSLALPFGLDNVASSEGRLLLGRAIATALFYIAIMRVTIVQYGLLRTGLLTIKSRYDSVDAIRRRAFQAVAAFIVNYGYIPRLFSVKRATEEDDDEDGILHSPGKVSAKKPSKDGKDGGSAGSSPGSEEDTASSDKDIQDESQGESLDIDGKGENEGGNDGPPRGSEERSKFQPFFFLDQVVT